MNYPKEKFTILLVDDRIENLISLEDMLEQPDRTFIKATSGNEALKIALKNDDIGLIMLDVQMPEMDGFEVARILKSNKKTKDVSIIFVTAINKEESYVMKGFEEGAVDYLQKPLDINVTCAKVNVFQQLYYYQKNLKSTASELSAINKQLERFVYIVAHDLKSPLSGIITMLSVLDMDDYINANARSKNYVDILSSAANHLQEMISSILEYSRKSIEQQNTEVVDVKELVTQITKLLFPPASISFIIDERLPVMTTKKLKLMQVFQNLISNAVKYNNKEQGKIEVSVKDLGEFYEFSVKDNGPGIPDKEMDNMFRLFQPGTNKSAGDSSTGVGLNLLRMLVEEQGGQINIDTKVDVGSRFWFTWRK